MSKLRYPKLTFYAQSADNYLLISKINQYHTSRANEVAYHQITPGHDTPKLIITRPSARSRLQLKLMAPLISPEVFPCNYLNGGCFNNTL